jgi:hypothetical protein
MADTVVESLILDLLQWLALLFPAMAPRTGGALVVLALRCPLVPDSVPPAVGGALTAQLPIRQLCPSTHYMPGAVAMAFLFGGTDVALHR